MAPKLARLADIYLTPTREGEPPIVVEELSSSTEMSVHEALVLFASFEPAGFSYNPTMQALQAIWRSELPPFQFRLVTVFDVPPAAFRRFFKEAWGETQVLQKTVDPSGAELYAPAGTLIPRGTPVTLAPSK